MVGASKVCFIYYIILYVYIFFNLDIITCPCEDPCTDLLGHLFWDITDRSKACAMHRRFNRSWSRASGTETAGKHNNGKVQ